MTDKLTTQLHDLNLQFYSAISSSFSETRSFSWEGWSWLLQQTPVAEVVDLVVTDFACGNGRLCGFLASELGAAHHCIYQGIDTDTRLLSLAKEKYLQQQNSFFQIDIAEMAKQKNNSTDIVLAPADISACFGYLHHIAGQANRIAFFRLLGQLTKPNGHIWISTWNFKENERLMARTVTPESMGIEIADTEWDIDTDFILDWKRDRQAFRYCHYYSYHEFKTLSTAAGLHILNQYQPTTGSDKDNCYYLLQPAV